MITSEQPESSAENDYYAEEQVTLKNELIREAIFERCSVHSLKACRLVNKSWYKSSQIAWKKYAFVKISDDEEMERFLSFIQDSQQNGVSHLYVNFSLDYQATKFSSTKFGTICGSQTKRLMLSSLKFPNTNDLRQFLFHFGPNMEELTLQNLGIIDHRFRFEQADMKRKQNRVKIDYPVNLNLKYFESVMSSNAGISWLDLLCHFPSIQRFHFCQTPGEDSSKVAEIFTAIQAVRTEHPTKLAFREMRITDRMIGEDSPWVPPEAIPVLEDKTLPLQDLAISLGDRDIAAMTINGILKAHGHNLKRFEIYGPKGEGIRVDPDDCFACGVGGSPHLILNKLQELVLNKQIFTSLTFLKYTPNLRKLLLNYDAKQDDNIVASTNPNDLTGVGLTQCTELHLGDFASADDLQKMVTLFPNVEWLKCALNNETFVYVCQNWPNMVSLKVDLCNVDEPGISGLDPELVEVINSSDGKSSQLPSATVQRPGLSCLKHLRELYMVRRKCAEEMKWKFGYASVLFGFHQAPSLQDVYLQNYAIYLQYFVDMSSNVRFYLSNGPTPEDRLDDVKRELLRSLGVDESILENLGQQS